MNRKFSLMCFWLVLLISTSVVTAGCMQPAHQTATQAEWQPDDDISPDAESGTASQQANGAPPAHPATQTAAAPGSLPAAAAIQNDDCDSQVYPVDPASLLNAQIHDIAVQLIDNMNGDPAMEGVVGVATFVDLNNLYRTSPLGRYLAEQLMGELQRAGFKVVEVRKTESILIKERYGEYSLSREIREIARQTSARMILVGTYLVRGDFVFVNARLVSSNDSMVASSAMKILRRNSFIKKMLWPSAAPSKGHAVKIPVKAFGEPTEVRIIQGS